MIVVLAIAVRPQAILLVVIGMARHPLVRVDLLDMVQCGFLDVRRPGRTLCSDVSTAWRRASWGAVALTWTAVATGHRDKMTLQR